MLIAIYLPTTSPDNEEKLQKVCNKVLLLISKAV